MAMNKILVSLHWAFHILLSCLLYYVQQSMAQYDPSKYMYIAISGFIITLILFTFMMIKNDQAWLYHMCIMLLGIMFTYKVLQLSLVSLWTTYCIAILYAVQLKALSQALYRTWGIWSYTLLIWLILPLYNLITYFVNKPVISSIFDNDFSIMNGANPIFTGIGYIVFTFSNTKNYLGNGPMLIFCLLTVILSLPLCFQYLNRRKDK